LFKTKIPLNIIDLILIMHMYTLRIFYIMNSNLRLNLNQIKNFSKI